MRRWTGISSLHTAELIECIGELSGRLCHWISCFCIRVRSGSSLYLRIWRKDRIDIKMCVKSNVITEGEVIQIRVIINFLESEGTERKRVRLMLI